MSTVPIEEDRGALASGTQIGNYRIERPLAEGGMGTVYEAVHEVLPRRAAIKVLHSNLLDRWSARERLLQEARILESLRHTGLVEIYDAGVLDDGRPWIAMELLDGPTVGQRLQVHGQLDILEAIDILRHTAVALDAAHRAGVIHRDLKPDNIVLCRGAGRLSVRVIDWGIARIQGDPTGRLTRANMTPGTPIYMSPEQARGKAVDGKSDIYTLGVIACEVLTGEAPFEGDTPLDVVVQHLTAPPPSLRSRRSEVPEALDRLVLAMLAKDASDRPSIAVICTELDAITAALLGADYEDVSIELEIDVDEPVAEIIELPHMGRPRWTPPLGRAVSGEIVARPRRRGEAGKAETLGLVVTTLFTALMLAAALALPALSALARHTERTDHVNVVDWVANAATSHTLDVARHLH